MNLALSTRVKILGELDDPFNALAISFWYVFSVVPTAWLLHVCPSHFKTSAGTRTFTVTTAEPILCRALNLLAENRPLLGGRKMSTSDTLIAKGGVLVDPEITSTMLCLSLT